MPQRVIKRYSNRKLYDTVARRFTTLEAVTRQIESGVRVVVRDHDTGDDLTDDVLAPVLARLVARRPGGVELLTDLLRTSTPPPAPDSAPAPGGAREDTARHEEEIRELRAQVSQLTDAVTLLMRERNDDLSA
ncbi:polyhydroxyalkanoate synthesis regulator DNA-binding domain-containing protein [Nocardioides caeni]|uniref:PHA accumulation regulator DNA-binding N-terminal domain-containing protein n=1 Tax=Nocardioides caeni TaxID=574700 RepID=A0A4S8N060_9ACTN|nr:polyhydroxyalkanoate synthesis regulator DNA-binding domain-containing protein [Nocardioides caeni]THV09148.1 hypothetical protein E9934_17090 [Nocardioides caeni]